MYVLGWRLRRHPPRLRRCLRQMFLPKFVRPPAGRQKAYIFYFCFDGFAFGLSWRYLNSTCPPKAVMHNYARLCAAMRGYARLCAVVAPRASPRATRFPSPLRWPEHSRAREP